MSLMARKTGVWPGRRAAVAVHYEAGILQCPPAPTARWQSLTARAHPRNASAALRAVLQAASPTRCSARGATGPWELMELTSLHGPRFHQDAAAAVYGVLRSKDF